jgi:hypothetical protein
MIRLGKNVGALAALISGALMFSACAAVEEPTIESAGVNGASASGAKKAGVGDKVTLKGTTYRVSSVKTANSIGDSQFTRTRANGRFVVVKLSLTNRKSEPATIMESNLQLIGGNGKTYSTSDDAILATAGTFLLEEIQPDNTEKGVLVYDLPKKAVHGAALRVSDLFSDSKADIRLGL